MRRSILFLALMVAACDPYGRWPAQTTVYPWVYTEIPLENYEEVRWETEDWDPFVDYEKSALYLLKALNHRPGAPQETLIHHGLMRPTIPPINETDVRLSLVGDVMWMGGNWANFADDVSEHLDGHLRIGNLETPTSSGHPTDPRRPGLVHVQCASPSYSTACHSTWSR